MATKRGVTQERPQTLHDHIRELRTRLFIVALVFVVASSVAYSFKDYLIHLLLSPLQGEKLVYLNPAGGFNFIFQISLYIGAAVAIPFLIFNLYRFVSPALPPRAQKSAFVVLAASLVLLIIGVAFGYIYAIPGALNFLDHFADGYVSPSLTADSYLNFLLAYTAGLGILFQLPLIMLFIHWIHPLKPGGLLKFERYMILVAFVAAAIITPTPDAINQTIIATPIILMYQAGFIAILISTHKAKKRAKRAAKLAAKQARKQPPANTPTAPPPSAPAPRPRPVVALAPAPASPAVSAAMAPPRRRPTMDIMRPHPGAKPVVKPLPPLRPDSLKRSVTSEPALKVPVRPTSSRRMSLDGISMIS